jgi:oligopeptide transport system substrate-binding protein
MRHWHLSRPIRALVLGTAALALVAFAARAEAETVLRIANAGEPKSLDPHKVSGTWENRVVGDMFLGLTTEAADGSTIPGAAESWEVSDDGLVYTFKLRPHTWSDGVPVTSEDFVYSLHRILDPALAAEYASLLYPIKNAEALNSGKMTGMDNLGVRAIDPSTLEITLANPTPYFLAQLSHYTAYPVPKHLIEAKGNDWVKPGTLVGNGPYIVTEWTPNSRIVEVKNDRYYDADSLKVDKVIFVPGEERNAATKQFRAGEIDAQYDFASEQVGFLKENLPKETRIAPYLGIYYYPLNEQRKPFDDARVREALTISIDRSAITDKVLKTGEIPAYSFVPPGTGDYGEPSYVSWKDEPYADRVARARKLLAEAGYGPDKPLTLQLRYNTSETHKKVAIAVAAMWKQLGITTNLLNADVAVHYDALKQGDFDVARAAWIADYPDPQNFLYLLQTSTGPNNYGRYSNPQFDQLMDEAGKERDQAKRMDLMHQAEAIALGESATIPIFYSVSKNLVATYVKGWVDNTKDIHRIRYLSIDKP